MSYAFVPQFCLAGGELHNLCWGLQLSIGVFQPIKRQTPQCKLVRCHGDLLLGSDLICLRPLQEGFCKCKEPCQTHREVPQGVSFFVSKIDIYFFCRDTTTSSHSVGSASATLPLPSTSATSAAASASMMDYNCPECTWSGRTKNVLTRHIRAKHQ